MKRRALALADQVWMLENSVYSVLSPEGAASIIWKDASKVEEASESLKFTAQDLLSFGIIERIFAEPEGGDFSPLYEELRQALVQTLEQESTLSSKTLLKNRYEKFRKIGRQCMIAIVTDSLAGIRGRCKGMGHFHRSHDLYSR